jgi:hypothetical protein
MHHAVGTELHLGGRAPSTTTGADFTHDQIDLASPSSMRVAGRWRMRLQHLREALRDQTYESLARKGETMTIAAMATYAYDQIDQARTELEHPS